MEWLASNETSLSAIAAIIAIIAGLVVVVRLIWTRMPSQAMSQVKRPAFLSDWRNIALICLTVFGLLLLGIFALDSDDSNTDGDVNSALSGKPSVAVLPLTSLSDDPEQAYLADGITEDVITLLSRNPRFFVIARNSTFAYKGQSPDIREVGEALGVRYVVEGSLRKVGERLRVTVQLIDTRNGQHLWAQQYDRALENIFALQDEITNGIAVALGDEIFTAEIARASSTPTDNLDAWGLVMRASSYLASFNRKSVMAAEPLLREALVLDPNYALAKAELARSLCFRAANFYSDDPTRDIAEAYGLGQQALESAPKDPLALFAIGSCYGFTGRPQEAIRLLEKAIVKQPSYALAMAALGLSLAFDGQPARGLPHIEKALVVSPQSPQTYLFETYRAGTLCELGRYAEAEQAGLNGLKSYDGWYWTWLNLAWARAGQGDVEGAKQALYSAKEAEPLFSLELVKQSTAILFKNKGKDLLVRLEPIWPENLLTTSKN
ncbi:MAG: hypothetical protein KUG72_12850 [Pseudomonadales bacterium]|nr:hypothetical protein [Pseudomonadales bacterium]